MFALRSPPDHIRLLLRTVSLVRQTTPNLAAMLRVSLHPAPKAFRLCYPLGMTAIPTRAVPTGIHPLVQMDRTVLLASLNGTTELPRRQDLATLPANRPNLPHTPRMTR